MLRKLLLIALLVVGCRPSGRPAVGPSQRIVSLLPSFTEILFAIGAGDRMVGRTTWCDYPPAAREIPSVGDGMPPSIEAVAARKPDLVVLYNSGPNVTAAQQLERIGIRTVLLDLNRLEDLGPATRKLGHLTGLEQRAESLATSLDSLVGRPRPPGTTSLAFVVWDNPPIIIGAGSYLDQLAAQKAGTTPEEARKKSVAAIPIGRYGDPPEYGRVAAFLLSDAASYMTGATVQVDGGQIRSVL